MHARRTTKDTSGAAPGWKLKIHLMVSGIDLLVSEKYRDIQFGPHGILVKVFYPNTTKYFFALRILNAAFHVKVPSRRIIRFT